MGTNLVGGIFVLWVLVTIAAFSAVFRLIACRPGSIARKIALSLGLVTVWVLLQWASLVLSFFLGYCENCSEKPISLNDVLVMLILIAPTMALVVLFFSARTVAHGKDAI